MQSSEPGLGKRLRIAVPSLVIGAVLWLPLVHVFFAPSLAAIRVEAGVAPLARELAARQKWLWTDAEALRRSVARMHVTNAEWDFMGRTFLVLSLVNLSLREPETTAKHLAIIDRVLTETLAIEKEKGLYFFLMPYAKRGRWVLDPPRSQFLDSEIALMLASRCVLAEEPRFRAELARRVRRMADGMRKGPVLCVESYPDECWMFCNTVALAAIRISDTLAGEDHARLFERWLTVAKQRLIDPRTGILYSSFTVDGKRVGNGPEGSSIWVAAHCLLLIDPEFARDQYRRARAELGVVVAGFGYAKEWPDSYAGPIDVDSGPIIPIVEASAGSSGCSLVAAAAFADLDYLRALTTTLELAAFPIRDASGLRYAASNQVGDAVLLYALTQGPLWERVGPAFPSRRSNAK